MTAVTGPRLRPDTDLQPETVLLLTERAARQDRQEASGLHKVALIHRLRVIRDPDILVQVGAAVDMVLELDTVIDRSVSST